MVGRAYRVSTFGASMSPLRRLSLRDFLLLAFSLLAATRCLPLAGWSAEGYSEDVSQSKEADAVVGHCFRLRFDAEIVSFATHITLRHGGVADVSGRVHVLAPGSPEAARAALPKGSRIVVEKVISSQNVESGSLTPYIRVNGALLDAGELFRYDKGPRLGPAPYLLDACD